MLQDMKGFAQFISAERGLMLFLISVGVTFLLVESLAWTTALFLGVMVFCIWSAADAMNNICDVDLDVLSDPARAQFTRKLGDFGMFIAVAFTFTSLALGAITMIPYVFLFSALGILCGVIYSVPPFRLRKTPYKPLVNFSVGFVPVLLVASFFDIFTPSVIVLAVLIGVTTAVNSLWEDLADYASDFSSGSRTVPILFGFRKGLYLTIILGYSLLPLMLWVGILFELGWTYYAALAGLTTFLSIRLIQKRHALTHSSKDETKLHKLGETLSKDFVIVAIAFTLSLMLCSLLKINPIF